ncbi:hypothetical protein LV779_26325 [Streptomyces thinghirensis]|nr:hypothetical protein [Streptomyces thinghirensis]
MVGRHAAARKPPRSPSPRSAPRPDHPPLGLRPRPARSGAQPGVTPGRWAAGEPPLQMLRAMQRDRNLTPEQAAARLVNEAEAGTRAGMLRNTLGDRFAGGLGERRDLGRADRRHDRRRGHRAIEAQGAEGGGRRAGAGRAPCGQGEAGRRRRAPPNPETRRSGTST